MMMSIFYLLAGVLLGVLGTVLFLRRKPATDSGLINFQQRQAVLEQQLADEKERMLISAREKNELQNQLMELAGAKAQSEAKLAALGERLQEQKSDLENLHRQMQEQFRNIATDILQKSSVNVQEEHRVRLNDILLPLREKIDRFETQVTRTNEERIREHQSMREQLIQLQLLNKTIGDEARNLVSALKGQTKTQGNWGEMILEKVLESSGLVKGREYFVQSSMNNEDGRRMQPDVIIHLPDQRHLVIDSKVSLIAYERYCSESDESKRELLLREHIASMRKHIRDLSSKNYQNLYQVNTLDFVLLFVPVEPAFTAAVEVDQELYNEALSRNIVIVSTSTLLATLRTIANIWRLEYQNKNILEIARQAGDLYDKFSGLIEDLIQVGRKMKDADLAYEGAMQKLHTGRGNLMSRVENIRKLGIKTSKQVNKSLLERTEDLIESDVPPTV
jgi:DNA recombination protein RmuC